jgi:O-antigen/teichoic acid export membrane protein
MFPFIIKYVGVEDYGIYLLVGAFVGYFGLLDFGVGSALVKYVAQYTTKEDKKTINEMVSSSFAFYLGIGIVICVSVLIIGTYYVEFFNISPDQAEKARFIAYLVAIGALTSWPMHSFSNILPGIQRYDIGAILGFISALITAVSTVIILLNGGGIIDMIFWGIVIGASFQLATVIITQRLLPYLELRREYMGLEPMKKIFKFSSVVFIGQIIGMIVLGTDRIVIGAFVSVAAITHYAIARKLHDIVHTASSLPASALLPAATELDTKDDKAAIERLVFRGGKYKCALILGAATVIFVLAEPIINVWMGPEWTFMALPTQVYISYWFVFAAWGVMGSVLLAQERYKPILILFSLIAILNLLLSLLLVHTYGVLGVVMGTAIPYFFVVPFIIPYGLKLMNVKLKTYLKKVIFSTYPMAIITAFLLYCILLFLPALPSTLIGLGMMGLIGLSTYFGLFYAFGLSITERKDVKKLIGMN